MGEDARQDTTGRPSTVRVSVQKAAEHLGTTVDAIRKRVQRNTIAHEKAQDGRVWVLLDIDRTWRDSDQDMAGQRQDTLLEAKEETITDLRDRVGFLERELERRGDETARLHQMLGGLTQANARLAVRVLELEAPGPPGTGGGATSAMSRNWLPGPRNADAYNSFKSRVLPSYAVGCLLTCAVGAFGAWYLLNENVSFGPILDRTLTSLSLLIFALVFGLYAGARDGETYHYSHFVYVGLFTGIATALAEGLVSVRVSGDPVTHLLGPFNLIFLSAIVLGTALPFVLGASLGSRSTFGGSRDTQLRIAWLTFAGTVLTALITLVVAFIENSRGG